MQILHLDPRMPVEAFVDMYKHLNSDASLPEVAIPVSDGLPQMEIHDSGDVVDSLVEPVAE